MVRAVVAPGIWRQGKEAALIEFISAGERTVGGKKKKKKVATQTLLQGAVRLKLPSRTFFVFWAPSRE